MGQEPASATRAEAAPAARAGRAVGAPAWLAAPFDSAPAPGRLALFALAYLGGAGLAEWLAMLPGTATTIWPPAGLYVAALLLAPPRAWPWWMATAFLAELAANALWFRNPLPAAAAIHAANAAHAALGAWLVGRVRGRPFRLASLADVLALLALGGVAGAVASAIGGTAVLALLEGQPALPMFLVWWTGDATGVLILAPLALVAAETRRADVAPTSAARLAEAGLLAGLALLAVGLAARGAVPLAYVAVPLLLWAALRFEMRGAAASLVALATLTAAFNARGLTVFVAAPADPARHYALVQVFLAVSSVLALVVGIAAREHREALERLRAANDALEARVAARTASLGASERRLRLAQEAAGLGDWEHDFATGQSVWPPRARALLGVGPDEPSALPDLMARIHPEDRDAVRRAMDRLGAGGSDRYHAEYRVAGPDGAPRWIESQGRVEFGPDGGPARASGVLRDVTERKAAEAALALAAALLERERERLALALKAGGLGVYEWRVGEEEIWWSEEAHALYGTDPATFRPTVAAFTALIEPEDREEVWRRTRESLATGSPFHLEYRIVRPDGARRWVLNHSRLAFDAGGRPERLTGVAADVTERKEAEQRARLLMREVNHRSKNLLSLVQAIARQTAAGDPAEFLARFEARLRALAANQDLLVTSGWRGVALDRLVAAILSHFEDLIGRRIVLDGPPVAVNAGAAQALALALHELATNAGKYGALSGGEGTVAIRWGIERSEGDGRFRIEWTERGGPPVAPPARRGFGTTVIGRMSRLALDAEVEVDHAPEGLRWRLSCPAARVLEGALPAGPGGRGGDGPAPPPGGGGPRVLVVEDEPLVAEEVAQALAGAGFAVLGPAPSAAAAMRLLEAGGCDAAVLDVTLPDGTSEPVAARLRAAGRPFVVVSAYAAGQRPAAYDGAPVVPKPADPAAIVAALRRALRLQATTS